MPMHHRASVGERWGKYGTSQANPIQCPCFMGQGWEKDGGSWEKPGNSHLMPMLHREREWGKYGKSHAKPILYPCFIGQGWEKDGGSLGQARAKPTQCPCFMGKGGRKVGQTWAITKKSGPESIRSSFFIKYSVCRFLALKPDIQKLVHLTFAH